MSRGESGSECLIGKMLLRVRQNFYTREGGFKFTFVWDGESGFNWFCVAFIYCSICVRFVALSANLENGQ